MSLHQPSLNENNIKIPIIVSLDLLDKKTENSKKKGTISPISNPKNNHIASFNSSHNSNANQNNQNNQNLNYYNILFSSGNYLSKITNRNKFKYSASSSGKLNLNNKYDPNNFNFIYFNDSNNQKKDIFPSISNNNFSKDNEITHIKTFRNDEFKLRKLINKRKLDRIDNINNHHFETLREQLKNSNNGLYLTSIAKENLNENSNKKNIDGCYKNDLKSLIEKNSFENDKKQTNIFQNFLMKSSFKKSFEEENEDNNILNTKIKVNEEKDYLNGKFYEKNKEIKPFEKKADSIINIQFNNQINDKMENQNKQDHLVHGQIVNNANLNRIETSRKENKTLIKEGSLKEFRKNINDYLISKEGKNEKGYFLNKSFSYKNTHDEYEGYHEKEAAKLSLENVDLESLNTLSINHDKKLNKNKLNKMKNSLIYNELNLNEEELFPLALINTGFLLNIPKTGQAMKHVKKQYLKIHNNNEEESDEDRGYTTTENLDEEIKNDLRMEEQLEQSNLNDDFERMKFTKNKFKSKKTQKLTKLDMQKKRLMEQILNLSDDEANRDPISRKSRATVNIRTFRPSLTIFKNTVYALKEEINYAQQMDDENKGLSQFEKIFLKINSLFKSRFEDKLKFNNRIKDTFMIENQLKIKEEYTKQIDEFYETKVLSLKDSINSIKVAEDLFTNHFMIKYYDYIKHVRISNEIEKQNLNKLKQNKNEYDIEVIKLNSQIIKMKDKMAMYTEYRNFMICVKERKTEPPEFFTGKFSQSELIEISKNKINDLNNVVNFLKNEINKIENTLKFENEKKNAKPPIKFAKSIPKTSGLNSIQNSNSKHHNESSNTNGILKISNFNNINTNNNSSMNNNSVSKDLIPNTQLINSMIVAAESSILNKTSNSNLLQLKINRKNLKEKLNNISKNDPNIEKFVLEAKLAEETYNLELVLTEKVKYQRYQDYLEKPIFKDFDEFYSELKKLERDNLKELNKLNEKTLNLHEIQIELFKSKHEEEASAQKYQRVLIVAENNYEKVKSQNKDLLDRKNKLIFSIKQQNYKLKKFKNSLQKINNSSMNFYNSNDDKDNLNGAFERFSVNNLYKSTGSNLYNYTENGQNSDVDNSENGKSLRNGKKPNYFNYIFSIFNLVNEMQKFQKVEILKNLSIEEQMIMMLKHVEANIIILLQRHEKFKKNPFLKKKLEEVTNKIDKENRAKKCAERMKQVLEDHKRMIERVNYKFNKLNVLPKRKCAPRFRPKDNLNSKNGISYSLNLKKKNEEDEYDPLDII